MATEARQIMDARAALRARLGSIVGQGRVLDAPAELIAHAHDAGFYRLIPKAIAFATTETEVQALFALSHELGLPLTFRAGGTSLSGQCVSDGILVDLTRGFADIAVEEGGKRVRVQPGALGGNVNRALAPLGAKMGPDPASIHTARMGGILSNNASGMCCGVEQNAYHTLESLTFVLPSGTRIDTAAPLADELLREREPELYAGLLALRRRIESQPLLAARIRAKYKMKNTCGYGLNAFVDHATPAQIFAHLLIGGEGTLAFISEAVLRTVPDLPFKLTGLLLFPDVYAACAAILPLREAGAKALELMDRASLRSVEDKPGMPASFRALGPDAAALLVEFQSATDAERGPSEARAIEACARLQLLEPLRFTHDAVEQGKLWNVRQGLFPSVGAVRKSGTTVIIEDVAFPLERLAEGAVDLTVLFKKHGYDEAIIFGHAKDGNLHFVITQSFNDEAQVSRYARFIDDLVELVVKKHDGALKAEHGTGRNMAPFVEAEWGPEAAQVMRELKSLADPRNLLNPGVIINSNPRAHLENLKPMPTVEVEVDTCIECGFCEPRCPSRELTLTPRQRIVLRREMARLRAGGKSAGAELHELEEPFGYLALDTCAVDGLCALACPVGIDTGLLTKRLRHESHSGAGEAIAAGIARSFGATERGVRVALTLGNAAAAVVGHGALVQLTRGLRAVAGPSVPLWCKEMPAAQKARKPKTPSAGAQAIYFPSCISRTMGRLPGEAAGPSLIESFVRVSERAGVPVFIPPDVGGACCGVPFSSKGYTRANQVAVRETIARFWRWSDGGRLPIVVDTSPCTYGLLHSRAALDAAGAEQFDKLRILDSVEFAHDSLLPGLTVTRRKRSVALHPVCSLIKMNLAPRLEKLARACSDNVLIPRDAGCCAFAGDRGFLYPELTASATKREAAEVVSTAQDGCYSSSRTCEIGLTRATGQNYRSILFLLEETTRLQELQPVRAGV